MTDRSGQPELFPSVGEKSLTDYQRVVYDALVAGEKLTPATAGERVHTLKACRYCARGDCGFADRDGRRVLEALVKKGLAAQRRPIIDGRRRVVYEAISPATEAQLRRDVAVHGVAFVKDGERVDPETVTPTDDMDFGEWMESLPTTPEG